MHRCNRVTVSIIALTPVIGCAEGPESATDAAANGNVLVAEWTGPYGGVPAFDRMDLADLKPALEAGMERNLAEIDEITANPDPPTYGAHRQGSGPRLDV
jgi:peptidyl-dipeptidase Dcp